MNSKKNKQSFPIMTINHWWKIREKFNQSIPSKVDEIYISTLLNMESVSAKANIIPYLKMTGIIDEEGKPTEIAKKWRDDSEYPKVCDEIIKKIYPQELFDIAPNANTDKEVVKSWFSRKTGVGSEAARRMALFYLTLLEKDASKAKLKKEITKKIGEKEKTTQIKSKENKKLTEIDKEMDKIGNLPTIHIDIQIHLSSDATVEQIDQIFKSMAKHIYRQNKE